MSPPRKDDFHGMEIAVIGMAGRFPKARDVESFWRNLRDGVHAISFFAERELEAEGVDRRLLQDPNYVKAGGVLEDAELFDAAFFDFNAREAEITDPQQRVFLECAWQALEDAGHDGESFDGLVGVYAGVSNNTYLHHLLASPHLLDSLGRFQLAVASDKDFLAPRVSYKLNLKGPSVVVQTSCSTSLVAVHLACQALLAGECRMALAGGVSIIFPQIAGYLYQQGGVYAPDGTCRAFDAKAQGTVGGRGAGVVVLRTLEDALAEGDRIRAIIKGSAINNDGAFKVGFTAPGMEGQARVLRAAHAVSQVEPETITYIEAHGTGTELGDPVEIAALTSAFRAATNRKQFCSVGSVKSNVGHLDAAAGVTGLIKTVLALEHGQIPPTLHFERPNPNIDFENSPFYVNAELSDWATDGGPRRAGVSSFGIGGTNAHVVLEEAPPPEPSGPSRPSQLLVVSARTAAALEKATDRLAAHLREHPDQPLADVAFTCQLGRRHFQHRRMLVCREREDAAHALAARDPQRVLTLHRPPGDRPVVFMFPGQGSQYVNMGLGLYGGEPTFRKWVDHCALQLTAHLGSDLRQVLYPPAGLGEEAHRRLEQTSWAQPALFVVEFALAQLWMEWGVCPAAMIGHSIGEYVAACLAEVLPLESALELVAARGRLMQSLPAGAMLAVSLPEAELGSMLGGGLSLAAVNGPSLSVVSGPRVAVEALAAQLAERGIARRPLHTSHAFHSEMMEPILDGFAEHVQRVRLEAPKIAFISNLTGCWITPQEATDPTYWVSQLRRTVRFGAGLATVFEDAARLPLEVGPGSTLSRLAQSHPDRARDQVALASLRNALDSDGDHETLLAALGRLWLAGGKIDWRGVSCHERRRRVPLPSYPFERRRFWAGAAPVGEKIDASASPPADAAEAVLDPASGRRGDSGARPTRSSHPRPELAVGYLSPEGEIEERLASIWEDLLGIEPVGSQDNFFELGGHSLLATQMVAAMRQAFRVEFPLRSLFDTPTVAGLAAAVAERMKSEGELQEGSSRLPGVVPDAQNRYEPFPLTDVQQAYWIGRSGAFELGQVATHSYLELECPGLDLERFNRAWRRVIERHDMLRAIVLPDGQQQILEHVPPYRIELQDLRGKPQSIVEFELQALRQRMSHQVLPADCWPLFEVKASLLDSGTVRLHVSFDLLIGDGWSWRILWRELLQFYLSPDLELPLLQLSFRDYVLAEVGLQDTAIYRSALEYWKARLGSLPRAPDLPLRKSLATIDRPRFRRWSDRLPPEEWRRLKKRATGCGLTPSGVLVAVFSEVLAAWCRGPRFTVNLTLFNRLPLHPEVNEIIGDFTSLTFLAVDRSEGDCFERRAQQLQRRLFDDLDHRYVGGVRVLRELARLQGGSIRPIMPVVFTSGLTMGDEDDGEDRALSFGVGDVVYSISQTPQVLIDHQVGQQAGALVFNWDAVEEAFPPGLLDDLFDAYCGLLRRLADDEGTWRSSRLGLVPRAQLEQRSVVNATATPRSDELLHAPFARTARELPGHPAVISQEGTLTYGELDRRSNQLARRLRRLGARRDRLVGVVLEKGCEQVIAVLAILRSGAAYLPIDPSLPQERQRWLLEQGEVELVVTRASSGDSYPAGVRPVYLDRSDWREEEAIPLDPSQSPTDLAYVLFTSGSTGVPKGVMIEHRGALNTILDVNRRFGIGPSDRVLALSALSFDLSVYDIFGALAAGATIVMPEAARLRDPAHWVALLDESKVTVWDSVPALMQMAADYLEGRGEVLPETLRLVLLSGDWVPVALPDQIRRLKKDVEIVSLGGATEASIWSILYAVGEVDPSWSSIPYGRPMANQTFHVLDANLEPCPTWVPGELYIGGIGLARGYWKDEEKTRARFLTHPVSGERIYRTGDLGRYLPDGDIEFLGREDFQVKIQGFRIELGEIEVVMAQHPAVKAAVAVAVGEPRGDKRLVAYVVFREGMGSTEELRGFLRGRLPDYMVPSAFVPLDALPLTANGKVDRTALPGPQEAPTASQGGFVAPRDHVELGLTQIWAEVLGRSQVGVRDNFFELGGHSLTAVRLATRIERELGFRIPLATFFRRPTIEDLAMILRDQGQVARETTLVPVQPLGSRPPFFWIHPVGGNVFSYVNLAQALGSEQPFFAFQSKGLTVSETLGPARVEDMAAEYCEELRRFQAGGPYLLGGWSMGGVVAFEMGRQLSGAGYEVAHLAIVDASAPTLDAQPAAEEGVQALVAFARELGIWPEDHDLARIALPDVEPEQQLAYLLEWAGAAGLLHPGDDLRRLARFFEVYRHNLRALANYPGGVYAGRVALFRAAESVGFAPGDSTLGWAELAQGGVELHVVPGNHHSVLHADQARHLADRLSHSVAAATAAHEPPAKSALAASGGPMTVPVASRERQE